MPALRPLERADLELRGAHQGQAEEKQDRDRGALARRGEGETEEAEEPVDRDDREPEDQDAEDGAEARAIVGIRRHDLGPRRLVDGAGAQPAGGGFTHLVATLRLGGLGPHARVFIARCAKRRPTRTAMPVELNQRKPSSPGATDTTRAAQADVRRHQAHAEECEAPSEEGRDAEAGADERAARGERACRPPVSKIPERIAPRMSIQPRWVATGSKWALRPERTIHHPSAAKSTPVTIAFVRTAPAETDQNPRSKGEAATPRQAAKVVRAIDATIRESPRTATAPAKRLMSRRW